MTGFVHQSKRLHSLASRPFDLLLTLFYMKPANETGHSSSSAAYVSLDPHSFDCLVVIVPQNQRSTSVIVRVLRDGHVQAIGCASIGFVVALQTLRGAWRPDNRLAYVWLYTLAMCLAQFDIAEARRQRRGHRSAVELIWHLSMILFSCVATATLAAIIYAKFVQHEVLANIDTLAELGESGLPVYVAELMYEIGDWFNNLE